TAFDILHGGDFKSATFADDSHRRSNGNARNDTETEKVGGIGKGAAISPFLIAVPTFPVGPDGSDNHIRNGGEAFLIKDFLLLHDNNKGVHFAKAHITPSNLGRGAGAGLQYSKPADQPAHYPQRNRQWSHLWI